MRTEGSGQVRVCCVSQSYLHSQVCIAFIDAFFILRKYDNLIVCLPRLRASALYSECINRLLYDSCRLSDAAAIIGRQGRDLRSRVSIARRKGGHRTTKSMRTLAPHAFIDLPLTMDLADIDCNNVQLGCRQKDGLPMQREDH